MIMNSKYLGLTIGPIIKTLSMARKPRELWSASYLFSHLMKMLINEIPDTENILSPATGVTDKSVGLFPDRLFYKSELGIDSFSKLIGKVKGEFALELKILQDYFNVYAVEIEAKSDSEAIKVLNEELDYLELYNVAYNIKNKDISEEVRSLIFKKKDSKLFELAELSNNQLEVDTLAEIASSQLRSIHGTVYDVCVKESKICEEREGKDCIIKDLKKKFPNNKKKMNPNNFITPHKYVCVVYADGDNIGKACTSINGDKLKDLSQLLLNFGTKACKNIRDFQGMPIYAGGDDLLFISPVISGKKEEEQTIFDLIKTLDSTFKEEVTKIFEWKDKEGKDLQKPSMSFGVSITYYKYPLYEALNISRDLLFGKAKHVDGKNAIAWTLQKNSGSAVNGQFSKTTNEKGEPNGVYKKFIALLESINVSMDENFVSAVPHKIQASEVLLGTLMGDSKKTFQPERLAAFFDNTLERKSKNKIEKAYLEAVEELLPAIHQSLLETNGKKKDKDRTIESEIIIETVENMYGILRTAKFIKGLEEDKDE